ncbi:MAG: hypothetical protein NC548_37775 [Lachnospiraceae bacterium]|nr:hypothetical protein [Lachnospiraceae bacterium]
MAAEYIVEKKVDGTWYEYGKWDDPVKLGLAMWELGLMRPEYEDLRIQKQDTGPSPNYILGQPAGWVTYLMEQYQCSPELAALALKKNGQSVIHAGTMLASDYERAALERELRDAQ